MRNFGGTMPIFEYAPDLDAHQDGCQNTETGQPIPREPHSCCCFEHIHRHGEPALRNCPTCGYPVRKVPSHFQAKVKAGSSDPITRRTVDALRASGQTAFATAWEETTRNLSIDQSGARKSSTDTGKAIPELSKSGGTEKRQRDADHEPSAVQREAPPPVSRAQQAIRIASGHVCTASCRHG